MSCLTEQSTEETDNRRTRCTFLERRATQARRDSNIIVVVVGVGSDDDYGMRWMEVATKTEATVSSHGPNECQREGGRRVDDADRYINA